MKNTDRYKAICIHVKQEEWLRVLAVTMPASIVENVYKRCSRNNQNRVECRNLQLTTNFYYFAVTHHTRASRLQDRKFNKLCPNVS